jgi:hypothetical protein
MLNKMKWQNPGVTYFGGGGSSGGSGAGSGAGGTGSGGSTTPTSFTDAALPGQTFTTQAELDAALAAQTQAATEQGIITGVQDQSTAIAADPNAALSASNSAIASYESQIANLTQQVGDNPGLQTEIDRLAELLRQEQSRQGEARSLTNVQAQDAQRALATNALTDPASIVEQAQVATTEVTPDQLIAAGTGNLNGPAPTVTAETVGDVATMQTPARQAASTYDAATVNDQVQDVTDDLQAATAQASDKATVRGQLAMLMEDFEGGETPPWASGPMRQAMQMMQSRGMGASSIAGAAVVQAAMESAISIAAQDANVNAQFEMQNLNNEQQTTIFKTQQRLAGLFSDQAALNASQQFNATSENQTNQFFSNLEASASQFNANQINAIRQFNAGETNAAAQFNSQLQNQREMFNAQNSLVISQANAQWRQSIATAATQAQNISNMDYVKNVNSVTAASLDQIWQRERDLMSFAFESSENSANRATEILIQRLAISATKDAAKLSAKQQEDAQWANVISWGGEKLLDWALS